MSLSYCTERPLPVRPWRSSQRRASTAVRCSDQNSPTSVCSTQRSAPTRTVWWAWPGDRSTEEHRALFYTSGPYYYTDYLLFSADMKTVIICLRPTCKATRSFYAYPSGGNMSAKRLRPLNLLGQDQRFLQSSRLFINIWFFAYLLTDLFWMAIDNWSVANLSVNPMRLFSLRFLIFRKRRLTQSRGFSRCGHLFIHINCFSFFNLCPETL